MGNNQKIKDVEISLGEMIATLIQSTIDADQAVTDDYLEEFERYAFEKTPNGKSKLTMVDFEMTDNEGNRQIVTIPKLSLLPLPVLHVSEATFDIEVQLRMAKDKVNATNQTALFSKARTFDRRLLVSLSRPNVSKESSETEQNINMKVHIKLQPTQLPNGMRGLLQASDSSIHVEAIE
jgi:hypothetical protein